MLPEKTSGRGVWESNPPGTAPSDPPAVLKTVRPTGAPTPPYSSCTVLCHSLVFLSSLSKATYPLHIYLGQRPHHQLCLSQTRQVTITCHSDTAHPGSMGCLYPRDCVFDHDTMYGLNPQLLGSLQKNIGGWLPSCHRLA